MIAESLGRHRSSIARELARNGWKPTFTISIAFVKRKLIMGNTLWLKVQDGLQHGLSPEQIAGTMSRMNEPICPCHETILCLRESYPQKP